MFRDSSTRYPAQHIGGRPSPGRSVVTETIRGPKNSRRVPAFIRTAPPTVPGMPTANSKSERPRNAASRTACESRSPAPNVNTPDSASNTHFAKPAPKVITAPLKPASETSKLEPLPNIVQGMPSLRHASHAKVSERRSSASIKEGRGAADSYGGMSAQRLVFEHKARKLVAQKPRKAPHHDDAMPLRGKAQRESSCRTSSHRLRPW